MIVYTLIMWVHMGAAVVPQYMGVWSSESACEIAAIDIGAMNGDAKPKHLCERQ